MTTAQVIIFMIGIFIGGCIGELIYHYLWHKYLK